MTAMPHHLGHDQEAQFEASDIRPVAERETTTTWKTWHWLPFSLSHPKRTGERAHATIVDKFCSTTIRLQSTHLVQSSSPPVLSCPTAWFMALIATGHGALSTGRHGGRIPEMAPVFAKVRIQQQVGRSVGQEACRVARLQATT